ncbi:hypothetical protein V2J09_020699 [Rumex salicifolius]
MDMASSPNDELLPGGDLRNPASEVDVVELRSGAAPSGEAFEELSEVAGVEGGGGSEEVMGGGVREEEMGGIT